MCPDSSRHGADADLRQPVPVVTLFGVSPDQQYAGMRMQLKFPGWEQSGSSGSSGSGGAGSKPGIREAVGSISKSSRRRLREAVWSVQPALLPRKGADGLWMRPASFITLTYPIEDLPRHVADPRIHKEHLRCFWQAFNRAYPGSWAVWVLEFQRNGNAHFHVLVRWGSRAGTWFDVRRWVADTWSGIIADGRQGDDDGEIRAKNRRVGTAVDALITGEALAKYISKAGGKGRRAVPVGVAVAGEMAKWSQKHVRIEGQGRWWGLLNRAEFKKSVVVLEVELPRAVGWKLWAAMRDDWRVYFTGRGLVVGDGEDADIRHLPRWLTAERCDLALREIDGQAALWSSPMVDVNTGEEHELMAADLGDAASA